MSDPLDTIRKRAELVLSGRNIITDEKGSARDILVALDEIEQLREALRGIQPYVKPKYGIPDEVCDAVEAALAPKETER